MKPSPITRTTTGLFNVTQTLANITCSGYLSSTAVQSILFNAVTSVLKPKYQSFGIKLIPQPYSCSSSGKKTDVYYEIQFVVTSLNTTVLKSGAVSIVNSLNIAIQNGYMTTQIINAASASTNFDAGQLMKFVYSNVDVKASAVQVISQTSPTQAPIAAAAVSATLFSTIGPLEIAIIIVSIFIFLVIISVSFYYFFYEQDNIAIPMHTGKKVPSGEQLVDDRDRSESAVALRAGQIVRGSTLLRQTPRNRMVLGGNDLDENSKSTRL